MSASPVPVRAQARAADRSAALEAVLLIGGLAAIVLVRAWASRAGLAPLAVGAAFGAGLLLLAAVGGASRPNARRIGPAPVPVPSFAAVAQSAANRAYAAAASGPSANPWNPAVGRS